MVFCIGIYLSVHFKNTFLKLDSQLRMSYLLNQRYKVMSLESQNKYKGNIPNLELVIKKILYLLSPTDAFRKQWNAKSLGIDKHSIMSSFNVFALCLFVWVFDNNNLNSEIFNIAIVASLYLLVVPLIVSFYPFNGFGPSLRYIQSGEAILYLLFAIISLTYGPNPLASTIAINLIVLLDIYFLKKLLKLKKLASEQTSTHFKDEVNSVIEFLQENLTQLSRFPIIPTHHSFGEHLFSYLHNDYLIWNVISASPRYLPLDDTFPIGHSTQILPGIIKKYEKSILVIKNSDLKYYKQLKIKCILKLDTLSIWLHKKSYY